MKTQILVILFLLGISASTFSQTGIENLQSSNGTWMYITDMDHPIIGNQYTFDQSFTSSQIPFNDASEYFKNHENGYFVASSTPQCHYQYPDTTDLSEFDTLFVSVNLPDADIEVIASLYAYGSHNFTWVSNTLAYILLKNGDQFHVGARWKIYSNRYIVFKENYVMSGTDTLEFDINDAIYEIDMQPLDANGTPFGQLEGSVLLSTCIFVPMNLGYFFIKYSYFIGGKTYLSELSADFYIQCSSKFFDVETNNTACFIEFPALSGINQGYLLENQPNDYIRTNLKLYITNEQVDYTSVGILSGIMWPDFMGYYHSYVSGFSPHIDHIEYWSGDLFLISQENDLFKTTAALAGITHKESQPYTICTSPYLEVIDDSICCFNTMHPPFDLYKAGSIDTLFFGESPTAFQTEWMNNNPDNVIRVYARSCGIERESIVPIKDLSFHNIRDSLGNIIFSGEGSEYIEYSPNDPGTYSVALVNLSAPLYGGFGISQLNTNFKLDLVDANPPSISAIQLRDLQNKSTYKIGTSEPLTLLFSVVDYNDEYDTNTGYFSHYTYQPVLHDSTKVFVKEHKTSIWQKLEIEKYHEDSTYGFYYRSDLSDYTNLDSSALDLRIVIQDYSGNTADYIIRPAILIDNFILTEIESEPVQAQEFGFSIYPNPASSTVNLDITSSTEMEMNLYIYDLNGKMITTMPGKKLYKGNNTFAWNLIDGSGLNIKPGTYFCVLKTDHGIMAKKLIVN